MGACCCCFTKNTEDQSASDELEHVPLSSQHAPVPARHLVDTNLDTSIPDTYRPPPIPTPYDIASGHPRTLLVTRETGGNKNDTDMQTTHSGSVEEAAGGHARESDCKLEMKFSDGQENEMSKAVESIDLDMEEEDCCPICLDEYEKENPKLMTKCEHYFHLACILEWMERSNSCPVCDQEMIFDPPID